MMLTLAVVRLSAAEAQMQRLPGLLRRHSDHPVTPAKRLCAGSAMCGVHSGKARKVSC